MFSGCLCCKPNDDATTTTYTVEKHANGEVQAVEPTINNRAPSQESNAQDKPPIIEEPTSKPNDKPPPPTQHVVDQCGDKVDAPLSSVASTDIELIIEEAKSISQNQEEKTEEELQIMAAQLEPLVKRLEAAVIRLESGISKPSPKSGLVSFDSVEPQSYPLVEAFDEIINGPLAKYMSLSNEIGAEVKDQAVHVLSAFTAQKEFLKIVDKSKKPSDEVFAKLIAPTSDCLKSVMEFSKSFKSAYKNNLSAICESIPSLGWVGVSPTPAPYVKDMIEAGQFYSNRVLKEFKEKDKKHVEWINSWKQVLNQLVDYIKRFHTTGLTWNIRGSEAKVPATTTTTTSGAPPPPGPPPPTSFLTKDTNSSSSAPTGASALFSDLNKGGSVTSGLKKVSNDMKTHKNPELRSTSMVTASAKPSTAIKPSLATKPIASKPPKCQLEGKKWIIENQVNNSEIVIKDTNSKQTAYIYNCQFSAIKVLGKLNSICLDNCKKTSILFDDVIASIDFVNCKSVEMQVNGKVPTINVDKTDGCKMYLSEASSKAEIITAKSSEMNVLIPQADGEFKEYCVAEQYKTVYNNGKLVTLPTDIAS